MLRSVIDIRIDEFALDECVTLKDVVALVTKAISATNSGMTSDIRS